MFVSELIKEEGRNVPNAFNYYIVTTDSIAMTFLSKTRAFQLQEENNALQFYVMFLG